MRMMLLLLALVFVFSCSAKGVSTIVSEYANGWEESWALLEDPSYFWDVLSGQNGQIAMGFHYRETPYILGGGLLLLLLIAAVIILFLLKGSKKD